MLTSFIRYLMLNSISEWLLGTFEVPFVVLFACVASGVVPSEVAKQQPGS